MSDMHPDFKRILDTQVIPYEVLSNLERCNHCGQYEEADDMVWMDSKPYHPNCPKSAPLLDSEELFND